MDFLALAVAAHLACPLATDGHVPNATSKCYWRGALSSTIAGHIRAGFTPTIGSRPTPRRRRSQPHLVHRDQRHYACHACRPCGHHQAIVISANTNEGVMQRVSRPRGHCPAAFFSAFTEGHSQKRGCHKFLFWAPLQSLLNAGAPTNHKPDCHRHTHNRRYNIYKPDNPFIGHDLAK